VQEDFRLIVDLVLVLAAAAVADCWQRYAVNRFTGLPAQWNGRGTSGLGLIKD